MNAKQRETPAEVVARELDYWRLERRIDAIMLDKQTRLLDKVRAQRVRETKPVSRRRWWQVLLVWIGR